MYYIAINKMHEEYFSRIDTNTLFHRNGGTHEIKKISVGFNGYICLSDFLLIDVESLGWG